MPLSEKGRRVLYEEAAKGSPIREIKKSIEARCPGESIHTRNIYLHLQENKRTMDEVKRLRNVYLRDERKAFEKAPPLVKSYIENARLLQLAISPLIRRMSELEEQNRQARADKRPESAMLPAEIDILIKAARQFESLTDKITKLLGITDPDAPPELPNQFNVNVLQYGAEARDSIKELASLCRGLFGKDGDKEPRRTLPSGEQDPG